MTVNNNLPLGLEMAGFFDIPPSTLSARQISFIDAIRFSAESVFVNFQSLLTTLERQSPNMRSKENSVSIKDLQRYYKLRALAYAYAWDIIDSFHRFYKLSKIFPRKISISSIKKYSKLFDGVESLRNYHNHIDKPLNRLSEATGNIAPLGALSWLILEDREANVIYQFVMCAGVQGGNSTSFKVMIPSDFASYPVDQVRIYAKDIVLSFNEVAVATCEILSEFNKLIPVIGLGHTPISSDEIPVDMLSFRLTKTGTGYNQSDEIIRTRRISDVPSKLWTDANKVK